MAGWVRFDFTVVKLLNLIPFESFYRSQLSEDNRYP